METRDGREAQGHKHMKSTCSICIKTTYSVAASKRQLATALATSRNAEPGRVERHDLMDRGNGVQRDDGASRFRSHGVEEGPQIGDQERGRDDRGGWGEGEAAKGLKGRRHKRALGGSGRTSA